MVAAWEWALLLALIILSALFSGSETALTSISRPRIRSLADQGHQKALSVDRLLKTPNRMLSTILIGNNLVNISISVMATSVALRLFGQRGVGITIAVLTVLMLVFGEITPKTYAATNAERIAFVVARPIRLLETLFYPAVRVLSTVSAFFIRLLGGKTPVDGIFVTEEEIRTMVNLGEGQGALEPQEKAMITRVFDLNDTFVREVMLPRIDVVAVPDDINLHKALATVTDSGHTRIPVYHDSLDHIVGIFHVKDLMRYCDSLGERSVRDIMREPFYVPETKRISELLRELRQQRIHIAVVLDEFGGTAGLVFLEDLVETIIGEIGDEFDKVTTLHEKMGPGDIRFSARAAVDDVNELLDVDLPQEEYDTLGGLAFHLFGHVPTENESIEFDDLTLTVESVNQQQIKTIRLKKRLH
jgi:CBS domain containing-hemolysin-like protein